MASFLSQLLQMKQSAIFSTFHSVTFICILVTYVYKTYYSKTTISIYYPTSFLWNMESRSGLSKEVLVQGLMKLQPNSWSGLQPSENWRITFQDDFHTWLLAIDLSSCPCGPPYLCMSVFMTCYLAFPRAKGQQESIR